MKRILIFFVFSFVFAFFGHSQNYSIKNRWNTKLSFSFNRINEFNHLRMHWDNIPKHLFKARLNMRAECNYGVLNWLELGGYFGYIRYSTGIIIGFAPDFGVNVNVHLLPFFVENKNCRWELYLTAKYGGAYLIHYGGIFPMVWSGISIKILPSGRPDTTYFYAEDSDAHYRHVFGIGLGGGVYFKNIFGLYAEALVGQFSYFPKMTNCYYTVRAGIEFKFYSKKHKEKMQALELKPKY